VRRRSPESLRGPLLAGWLFADLMLLLFVVGLGFITAEPAVPAPKVSPTVKPTGSATRHTAPPTKKPTPKPTQRVLQKNFETITVTLGFPITDLLSNPGNGVVQELIKDVDNSLNAYVAQHPALAGRVVGAAAINGYGPFDASGTGINDGTNEAKAAARLLDTRDPKFYQASFLPGWTGEPANSLVLHMFFYS
jgi:hypothetical protein